MGVSLNSLIMIYINSVCQNDSHIAPATGQCYSCLADVHAPPCAFYISNSLLFASMMAILKQAFSMDQDSYNSCK